MLLRKRGKFPGRCGGRWRNAEKVRNWPRCCRSATSALRADVCHWPIPAVARRPLSRQVLGADYIYSLW